MLKDSVSERTPLTAVDLSISRRKETLILLALLVIGAVCRLVDLTAHYLKSDEAESSINALTVLQHGYPVGSYLGEPIYENVVIQRSPKDPEFEFRDISYSDKGLATYHGWLPLYAMACSFRLFGIAPDPAGASRPLHDAADRDLRTIAARTPSVIFGLLGILAFYLTARRLHGRTAAVAAALSGAVLTTVVGYSQEARYYAATAVFTTLCMWAIAAMKQTGSTRFFIWGVAVFSCLFYSHLLSFFVAIFMWVIAIAPELLSGRLRFTKPCLFLTCVTALCLPWVLASGFLRQTVLIPSAWRLMRFPEFFAIPWVLTNHFGLVAGLGGALLGALFLLRKHKFVGRIAADLYSRRGAILFLCLWLAVAYLAFIFGMPAASVWTPRLSLMLLPASVLLAAVLFCAIAAAIPHRSRLAAIVLTIAFVFAFNNRHPLGTKLLAPLQPVEPDLLKRDIAAAVDFLSRADLKPATKLFASPDAQLPLTFYSGMRVQSIIAVRRSYLDAYPGEVILFMTDDFPNGGPLQPQKLRIEALKSGVSLTDRQAEQLSCGLASLDYRLRQSQNVARVEPPIELVPSFAVHSFERYRSLYPGYLEDDFVWYPNQFLLARGKKIRSASDWWFDFFYLFANPAERQRHPNYSDRVRNATLTILPCSNFAVYVSPGPVNVAQASAAQNGSEPSN